MATKELRVMVGVPGSGKSYFVDKESFKLHEFDHYSIAIISRDRIRKSFLQPDDHYFAHEVEVFNKFIHNINYVMKHTPIDIIFVDATHIDKFSRIKLLSRLLPDPSTDLVFEVIDTPLDIALKRNSERKGFARVPDEAIIKMAKKFTIPDIEKEIPEDKYGFRSVKVNIHSWRGD